MNKKKEEKNSFIIQNLKRWNHYPQHIILDGV